MGYATESSQPSVQEQARSGDLKAIAYWLNVFLLPHNLFAQAEAAPQPGCIRILVEFHPSPEVDAKSPEFQQSLVRFICHHIWKLNSDEINGVQVIARFIGKPQMLWRKTVKVISPARRAKLAEAVEPSEPSAAEATQIKTRIRQVTRQKVQFRALRSLLLTGTTAAAFIIGCWLGYADSPSDQKTATAANSAVTTRSNTVTTALEPVQVETAGTSPDGTATLLFGGDVSLTHSYADLVKDDKKWAFAGLQETRLADVSIVNLEAPFTTASDSTKSDPFKVDPTQVEVLKNGGISLVNLANNRVMDYQGAGLEETMKTLDQAGIRHFGAGRDAKEARRPEILDVDGQRVAYLGYFGAEDQAAGESKPGTNLKQNDRIAADIKALRDQVDWVVVNFHWGDDISKYPSDAQIELAHFSIDQGADLVVGHHSSILQGAEIYKGRPIVYSLGNFIFGGKAESDYDSAMLRVALKERQMKVELLPVEVKGFQPHVAIGDRGTEILQQIQSVSDVFHQPLKSPTVIDARSNTVTQPDATSSPNSPPIVEPDSTPEQTVPEQTNPTLDQTAPDQQPPTLDQTTPESSPNDSQPAPSPEASPTSPDSFSSPTPSSESQSSPADPAAQPTATPSSEQPWNNNSFINKSNTGSPAPMVPQSAPTSPQATDNPIDQPNDRPIDRQTNLGTLSRPIPANSLEPSRRQYAEIPHNAAIADAAFHP
ncbi:MAG: CapA family protein [Plectolyngbya sp. WJT66-NPBG17]|jgi:poly-gamma-glutamate synthesis protein (capsule biosynthesis protein)|nr:CapA family protein [Plectolyngbya sp. WJT66-NPBG17]